MCEREAFHQCSLRLLLSLFLSLAHLMCRRIFGSLVAGLMAGIWGVTGWIGFAYYFAAHAAVSSGSLYIQMDVLILPTPRDNIQAPLQVTVLLWYKTGGKIDLYFPSRWAVLQEEP